MLAVHLDAPRAVELLIENDRHVRIGDQFVENLPPHVRLETPNIRLTVRLRDRVVEFRSNPAKRPPLAQEVRCAESAAAHSAQEVGRVHEDYRTPLPLGRDRRGDCSGRVTINDDIVNGLIVGDH